MQISARNIFKGTVRTLHPGPINSEVEIALGGNDSLVAQITNSSAQQLGLAQGSPVVALVKASSILVMSESSGIRLSARNILTGKVTHVSNGQVSSEVTITLPSGTVLHATITLDAVRELGIREGVTASAVFKASAVILGVAA
ncbi:MAG: TOBE domain-containing protein [Sideroxydans sp.]|nr:TOBE domain-containing protein [Sideroxydans sp.]